MNLFYAISCFILGHIIGWYSSNIQFTSAWWSTRPLLSVLLFGIPSGLFFWYGTKYFMMAVPELWSARFVAAVISYFIFPLITWYHLAESPFTLKTMICLALSALIIMVQIFVD